MQNCQINFPNVFHPVTFLIRYLQEFPIINKFKSFYPLPLTAYHSSAYNTSLIYSLN